MRLVGSVGSPAPHDATAVARLRAAGAVIIGKTVTTEFAYFTPGKTRNPHDPKRTPGGSSSGSAAAVAAGMVPIAIGSQTNGSIIRPAAFCGVFAIKPSHGLVSRAGVLSLSHALDHIGPFARSIEDLALSLDVIAGYDPADPDTRPLRRRAISARSLRKIRPRRRASLSCNTPVWDKADAEAREGVRGTGEELGERASPTICRTITLRPGTTIAHHGGRHGAQSRQARRPRRRRDQPAFPRPDRRRAARSPRRAIWRRVAEGRRYARRHRPRSFQQSATPS